jgi:hypothetical protein
VAHYDCTMCHLMNRPLGCTVNIWSLATSSTHNHLPCQHTINTTSMPRQFVVLPPILPCQPAIFPHHHLYSATSSSVHPIQNSTSSSVQCHNNICTNTCQLSNLFAYLTKTSEHHNFLIRHLFEPVQVVLEISHFVLQHVVLFINI